PPCPPPASSCTRSTTARACAPHSPSWWTEPTPMSEQLAPAAASHPASWPGWCCSYCAGPLSAREHGLVCAREERWFATQDGVHRLLTQERRRELQPALEAYQRVRRDEGWTASRGLPEVAGDHPYAEIWRRRGRHCARTLA